MNNLCQQNIAYTIRNSEDCFKVNRVHNKAMCCLYVNLPTDSQLFKDTKKLADSISPYLNSARANNSKARGREEINIDNLAGLLAEKVYKTVLEIRYGKEKVTEYHSKGSKNQIDIILDGKTLEVRSSFIFGSIDDALFGKKKDNPNEYSYHIVGPYSNGVKPGERLKDYYVSVLFITKKENFLEAIKKGSVEFCIVGGATKEMFNDNNIFRIRPLKSKGKSNTIDSLYRLIPFEFSLDAIQLFSKFEEDNPSLKLSPFYSLFSSQERNFEYERDKLCLPKWSPENKNRNNASQ